MPRERAEPVKNDAYWNARRVPKIDRIVFVCAPEDSGRSAALLSGSPVELEALMTGWRGGARADMSKDVSATNVMHVTSDPFYAANRLQGGRATVPDC